MNFFKRLSLFKRDRSSDTHENQQGKLVRRFCQKGSKKGQLLSPKGIALTKSGDIVVSDSCNHRIQIFSSNGSFKFKFGEEGSKPHNLYNPRGLVITSDDLIAVADIGNSAVKIFTQGGKLNRCIEDEESLLMPNGLSITHDGYFVLTDISKHCVIVISPVGDISHSFTSHVKDSEELDHPYYVTTNSRKQIVVSDMDNNTIKVFDFKGTLLHAYYPEDFKVPPYMTVSLTGVTCDLDDNLLVCCTGKVFMIAKNGRLLEILNEDDGLTLPIYLTCSASGHIFLTQMTPKESEVCILQYNKDDFRDALKRLEDEDNSEGQERKTEVEVKGEGDGESKENFEEEKATLDQTEGATNPNTLS